MIKTERTEYTPSSKKEIRGKNGNEISNTSSGHWNFYGAQLDNAVVPANGELGLVENIKFVSSYFTGLTPGWYTSINDAIDALTEAGSIFIFSGEYQLGDISGIAFPITLQGVGDVTFKNSEANPDFTFNNCQFIEFKNIKFRDDGILQDLQNYDFINSSNSALKFSNCSIFLDIDSAYGDTDDVSINIVKLLNPAGTNTFDNCLIYYKVNTIGIRETEAISLITLDDDNNLTRLNIQNCQFYLEYFRGEGATGSNVRVLDIVNNNTLRYSHQINNSGFEVSVPGDNIHFDLIMSLLPNTNENFEIVSLSNSFSNVNYSPDIIDTNVSIDSNYRILI